MTCTAKYGREKIDETVQLARSIGSTKAARKTGIPRTTISTWLEKTPENFERSRSDLLKELSDLILTHGPEIASHLYEKLAKNPGAYKREWGTWVAFRNEAATLCPYAPEYNRRIFLEIKDGVLVGGSDFHYWPYWGASTAHRALVKLAPEIGATHVILNGDVPDFPQITHHRPIAWKKNPKLDDELEEVETRVTEIEKAYPGAERYWNWGNHCIRFDNRLAEKAPEYEGITGMRLTHHFSRWKFQNALRINEHELEIKHRYKGGQYAVANNTKDAGISYWTGHDHNRQIYRWKDLRGVRYGMNPGMAAEPWGPQFEYNENHPTNHDSGILVVQFKNYRMMPPEMVEVVSPGVVWFRGKRYEV